MVSAIHNQSGAVNAVFRMGWLWREDRACVNG
jgi:hypothetical protein